MVIKQTPVSGKLDACANDSDFYFFVIKICSTNSDSKYEKGFFYSDFNSTAVFL